MALAIGSIALRAGPGEAAGPATVKSWWSEVTGTMQLQYRSIGVVVIIPVSSHSSSVRFQQFRISRDTIEQLMVAIEK